MENVWQTLWLILTDPNIAFLLLVLGIWSIVLAVSLPGTGVPEAVAVISISLATLGLIRLPVSLLGLGLIVLALVLFILEFQVQSHGALLLAGALALGVGALSLFRAGDRSEAELSWVTVIGGPLISSAVFGYIIRKGMAAQRAPAMQDLRHLIGMVGETRTPVEREGTVYVAGELWSATADNAIPPDTDVVVVDRKGLTLKVAPAPQPVLEAGQDPRAPA